MSSKKNWRTGVAVLAAAGMVVVGVDYASYATTGHSLILGKDNTSSKTTTISRSGTGPALALDGKSALLKLSNTKKIAKLNADLVDGKDSTQLEPGTLKFQFGTPGGTFTGSNYYSIKVPAGTYVINADAVINPGSSGSQFQCLVVDYDKLVASDYSGVLAVAQDSVDDFAVSTTRIGTVAKGANLLVGCADFSANTDTIYSPPQFTFRPIKPISKSGTPFVPKAGQQKLTLR